MNALCQRHDLLNSAALLVKHQHLHSLQLTASCDFHFRNRLVPRARGCKARRGVSELLLGNRNGGEARTKKRTKKEGKK
jgi:hypothetical protein